MSGVTHNLFTLKARGDCGAWRVLRYAPDLNRGCSGARNQLANRKTRNFHRVMDAMMRGMVKAQAGKDCRLKKVPLKLCSGGLLLIIVCALCHQ